MLPWVVMTGSATPSSSTRRRMVSIACVTVCSRTTISSAGRSVSDQSSPPVLRKSQPGQFELEEVAHFPEARPVEPQDVEPTQTVRLDVVEINVLIVEAFGQLLPGLVGEHADRVLGVDPHDQVDAALEVQPSTIVSRGGLTR